MNQFEEIGIFALVHPVLFTILATALMLTFVWGYFMLKKIWGCDPNDLREYQAAQDLVTRANNGDVLAIAGCEKNPLIKPSLYLSTKSRRSQSSTDKDPSHRHFTVTRTALNELFRFH